MKLGALTTKLWRDAWHYRGQLSAIAAVVACGIALFVATRSMNGYLRDSRDRYYAEYRFADVFVPLRRAPARIAREASEVPGIAEVEGRIVMDVLADVRGLAEPATLRLVSVRVPRQPSLNEVHLFRGRWPSATDRREVVASAAFAAANNLLPGDSVGTVMNGRQEWLRIVGLGTSPEYVYEIGTGIIFPDNKRFGVVWMSHDALAAAMDLQGAFNDLVIRVTPGASIAELVTSLDRLTARYGGPGAYGRDEQVSHQFLSGEIDETQITAIMIPAIFLSVTAFLINMVLSRLVSMQRDQIAMLKAFGYSSTEVGLHYLGLAMVPLVGGVILGTTGGAYLARGFADLYKDYFQFPSTTFVLDWSVVRTAVAVGLLSGAAGAVGSVLRSVKLPPAEAMRPETPMRFRQGAFESGGVGSRFSPQARVIIRNLERRPFRTSMSVIGLALACGLVITVQSMFDAIEFMKTLQFHHVERAHVTVFFREVRDAQTIAALGRLDGVLGAEGFRVIPVRLSHAGRSERTAVFAWPAGTEMRRAVDASSKSHSLPSQGLLLSSRMARDLGTARGDEIMVEWLEGKRQRREVVVAGTIDDVIGSAAFADLESIRRLEGGEGVYSGAYLRTDPRHADDLYKALKRMPAVSAVSVREATLRGYEETIAESFGIVLGATLGFACVIAFGIVYNSARVALSERGRELASLRILGFTRQEVSTMLLGEQVVLMILALPVGFAVSRGLMELIRLRFDSELFRIPVVMESSTYVFGALLMAVAAALAALAVRRRINRLDLVAVLKTRE